MINKLRLTNFKGVKQGEIELSPLTILVGSNNSGKSTVLEALFLAPNPARQVLNMGTALDVVLKQHQMLGSQGTASLLHNYNAKEAKIECDIDGESYTLSFIRESEYIYLTSNKQRPEWSKISFSLNGSNQSGFAVASSFTGLNQYSDNKPFIGDTLLINSELIKPSYDYLRQNWTLIMNSGAFQKVMREVSELSNETYTNVTLEPFFQNINVIYAFLEDGRRIRLSDLGEGIQSYIVTKLIYEIVAPEVLLWDDIEAHLNPRMLVRLSDWFSDIIESGKQIVITTHSIEAVKILAGANPKLTSILLTSLRHNNLKARHLPIEEIDNLSEAGIDVRMAEPFLL